MHALRPAGATLAAVAAALLSVPSCPGLARAADAPPVPRTGGVVMAAPEAAYDTLRHALAPEEGPPARGSRGDVPLLLDAADFGFGTSVVFDRMPSVGDLRDLAYLTAVQHVVVSLPDWPEGYDDLLPLGQSLLPEGADLIVLLPGYPPSRAAAEAWNYLRLPLRIVLLVDGPPGNRAGIDELNRMRGLERVIADMPEPSRTGFERLQRPLSFRVVKR